MKEEHAAVIAAPCQSIRTHVDGQLAVGACVVRAVGLGKRIDGRGVLAGITFEVFGGAFVGLLGANGAGKSTLLRVLATLTAPTEGRLELFGLAGPARRPDLRARLGLIGHQPMLYRDLTVLENLEFFGRLYGVADVRGRAMDLLDQVNLTDRAGDSVASLSRGMAQRIAIARALMHRPDLLLADEPFTGLDAPSSQRLSRLLHELREGGCTVVLAHHHVAETLAMTDRVLVLREGRLVLDQESRRAEAAGILAEIGARP
jgi:heme exporter protein A